MTDKQVLRAIGFAIASNKLPANPTLAEVLAEARVTAGQAIAALTNPAISFLDEK